MASYTTTSLSITDHGEAAAIASVHQDIVEEHILGRLDGLSLASLSCTSSYYNTLSSQERFWRKICLSTWPSINHPRVPHLISDIPNGHRRFFSDCSSLLTPHDQSKIPSTSPLTTELISAVDIWFQNKPVFSRVKTTETESEWFVHSPFRVDLLDPKEIWATHINFPTWDYEMWYKELEENLTLSWIILDPRTKKGANLSSLRPVSAEMYWLTGDIRVEFATVLGSERAGFVECKVVVMCSWFNDGELHVREVFMQMKDMDGKDMNGKESLVCLVNGLNFGKRIRLNGDKGGKNVYEEFLMRKRLRIEMKALLERRLEMVCGVGVLTFVAFCIVYLVVK